MPWQGIVGHDRVVERFSQAFARGRLASSYLFVGPPGVGKRTLALKLAQGLLCSRQSGAALDPCGACESCRMAEAGTHPDIILIQKPADKSELPVALFIGDREHRMQVGLCHDIGLRPYQGQRKIAVIDDADLLGEEAANSLLKTLEEPPAGSVLILIGTSTERQLPTIRSRCQVVRFDPLPPEDARNLIARTLEITDPAEAQRLAESAGGSLQRAKELVLPGLWEFRDGLLKGLADLPAGSVKLSTEISAFVEQAGKEAAERRVRARQTIEFALSFYRELLRRICDAVPSSDIAADPHVRQAIERAVSNGHLGDELTVAACAERCVEALSHLDRNAHVPTLVECWIDDLGRLLNQEVLRPIG